MTDARVLWRNRLLCTAVLLVASGACGARGGLDVSRAAMPADAGPGSRDASRMEAGPVEVDAGSPDAGPESDIGDPCGSAAECLSADEVADVPACIQAGIWPNGHLWEDGYCTAQCIPSPALSEGEPFAREGCPPDALCVPFEDGVGVCLLACDDDAGCRMASGFGSYSCRRWFGAGSSEDPVLVPVGVCMAAHCQTRGCERSARCDC